MKLSAVFISLAIAATSVSAAPAKRDVDPALIPNLGATAGKNPDGMSIISPLIIQGLIKVLF